MNARNVNTTSSNTQATNKSSTVSRTELAVEVLERARKESSTDDYIKLMTLYMQINHGWR